MIILTLMMVSSTSAAPTANWGVEVGDAAYYYIDSIYFTPLGGEVNLAEPPVLAEGNRTIILAVTHVSDNSLNYSLAFNNGSDISNNQQISLDELSVGITDIILPSGDLPFVLPLAVDGYASEYLKSLRNSASLIDDEFISSFIGSDSNFSFIDTTTLTGVYSGGFLNITADFKSSNVSTTIDSITNITGIIDSIEFDSTNRSLESINGTLNVSYNSTDGMLSSIEFDSAISINNTETATMTTEYLNATFLRTTFIPYEQTLSSLSSLTDTDDASFAFLAMVPALLVVSRKFND